MLLIMSIIKSIGEVVSESVHPGGLLPRLTAVKSWERGRLARPVRAMSGRGARAPRRPQLHGYA